MARTSKAKQSEKTQRVLIATAYRLFTKRGYAGTSTQEIVRRAKVTRGALYYHYRDKAALFEAVFSKVGLQCVQYIEEKMLEAKASETSRGQQRMAGCRAFIEIAATSDVQRIIFQDGMAVMGLSPIQIDNPVLDFLQEMLVELMDEGIVEEIPLPPVVHTFWILFFGAGRYIIQADDKETAKEDMLDIVLRFLNGLRPQDHRAGSMTQ